jgi:hypothetical protein
VFLTGTLDWCGPTTVGTTTIFTLPAGFRPLHLEEFIAPRSFSPITIFVQPTGAVQAEGGVVQNDVVSLSGLSFRCGPSGTNGCP